MKTKKMKSIGIPLAVTVLFFVTFFGAGAYDAPRIFIKEINVDVGPFAGGDTVNGDFQAWNSNNVVLSNLSYAISLRAGNTIFKEDVFSFEDPIGPNQTMRQKFSFTVPKNIRTDEYDLRIQIFTQSGLALNWEEKKVSVAGNGVYLYLSDVSLLKGGTIVNASRGENFRPDIVPQLKFTATNSSENAESFNPVIAIYDMQISGQELKTISLPEKTLEPGEGMEFVSDLAQFTKPASYLGKVSLYIDGEPASNVGEFRWVVEGSGARVTNVSTDKNSYGAGEEIKVTIDLVGPADNREIGDGKLVVSIFDQEGRQVAIEERAVKLGSSNVNQVINFVSKTRMDSPKIEAKIFRGEQELDKYVINEQSTAGESYGNTNLNTAEYVAKILFVMIATLIALLFAMKYLKKKGILAVLIFSSIVMFGGSFDKADAWTVDATWNKPIPNPPPAEPYYLGDPITFQGSYANYACANEITDIKISSYICDVNEEHCASTGNFYSAWLTSLTYDTVNKKMYASNSSGNSVMRLDFNAKNVEARYGMREIQAGEFDYPWDTVFVASTGYVYASDSSASRLVRFKPEDEKGTWEQLGGLGSDIGKFNVPKGLYYDPAGGYLYIADSLNSRIVRFKPSDAVWTNSWESFGTEGNYGSGPGHFRGPEGVFYDSSDGYLYVGDTENYRVVRLKPLNDNSGGYSDWRVFGDGTWGSGELDSDSFRRPSAVFYSSVSKYVYLTEFSGYTVSMFKPDDADWTSTTVKVTDNSNYSSDDGGFAVPADIFYDAGYIYVTDSYRGIVKFQQGNVLATWEEYGSKGVGKGNFNFPIGFDYDVSMGYMYVADSNNKRIVKFDYNGTSGDWSVFGSVSDLVGSFNKPTGVFYDVVNNHLYVADSNNSRVVRFTPNADGTFSNWDSWGGYGSTDGKFIQPLGIYYDAASDILYVSDSGRNQIIKFRPKPNGIVDEWRAFGSAGNGVGQFREPFGINYDAASGYLYIADQWNTRIDRFKPNDDEAPVSDWTANWQSFGGGWGTGIGQFEMPMDVYYDNTPGQEYLYVADFNNGRMVRFRPDDAVWTDNWKSYGSKGQGGGQFQYVAGLYYDQAEKQMYVADSNRGGYSDTDNTRIARFDPNGNTVGNFAGNWDMMDMSFMEYLINTKVPLAFEAGFTLGTDGLAKAKIVVEAFTVETGRIKTYLVSYGDIYLSMTGNTKPTLNILPQLPIDYCAKDLPGAVSLRWEFDDGLDGYGNQTAYEIELMRDGILACNPGKRVNSSTTLLGTEINKCGPDPNEFCDADPNCANFIDYGGHTYTWRLKVFDSDDNENIGGFIDGSFFPVNGATPTNEYPVPEFNNVPDSNLKQYMDITFDPSPSRIDDDVFVTELGWDFDGDGLIELGDKIIDPVSPGVDLSETKVHAYSTEGSKTVDLHITDSDGHSCWAHDRNNDKVIDILKNKPKWNEAVP